MVLVQNSPFRSVFAVESGGGMRWGASNAPRHLHTHVMLNLCSGSYVIEVSCWRFATLGHGLGAATLMLYIGSCTPDVCS